MNNANRLTHLHRRTYVLSGIEFHFRKVWILSLLSISLCVLPDDTSGQITQVGASQTGVGTNTVTLNKPAGISPGDVMIATISYNETSEGIDLNVPPFGPSGWVLVQDVLLDTDGGDLEWRGSVFYKIADASDLTATSYLFDLDNDADGAVGGLVGFTGVHPSSPFDVAPGTINVTNSSTITATTVTTVTPNAAVVMLAMVSDNNTISNWTTTSPGPLTELFDAGTGTGGDSQVGAAWAIKAAAGPTGNGTATMGSTDENGGIFLVLRQGCDVNFGTLASGDQSYCPGSIDPDEIIFSSVPSGGTESFTYQWYYQDGLPACPTGTSTIGWTLIDGATSASYDPPSGVTASRTYAVRVVSVGNTDCPNPVWASGCRKITVLPALNFGTVANGDQTLCQGGDPGLISLSSQPSGGSGTFSFQWYYQDGLPDCPSGTDNTGWTLIGGAISNSYNPPSGLNTSRTYALMVDPTGSPECGEPAWANQCRKITILSAIDSGTLESGDETICNGGNPSPISFAIPPSGGAGTFTYQWYFQNGTPDCPTGSSTSGWTLINTGGNGTSYDPPSGLNQTRTYAVQINPTGSPDCGSSVWASSCRRVTVLPAVNFGTLASGNQTFCPGSHDPAIITFSTMPSGGAGTFSYQWYYQEGSPSCPSGTNTTGWTLIDGAISANYDPPSGVTSSRVYAVQVDETGSPDCGVPTWANSCRSITVLSAINYGTLANGDATICNGGDPANIAFSSSPSGGTGSFTYQWYYQDGLQDCPSGTDNTGWTLISGATNNAYNPSSGLATSRTYAVMVNPSGNPDCGDATWASGCRKITVLPVVDYGTLSNGDESYCTGTWDPAVITFSTLPSGATENFTYQWYSQAGLPACPSGSSTAGWTMINGATASSYDPPALSSSITYAVQVNPAGTPDCGGPVWANGCRRIVISSGEPSQPSTISGPSVSCGDGSSGPYSVTNVNGVVYTWSITGLGFSIASGQGTNSVTINAGSAFPQTLTVTPSNACGNGLPRTYTVTDNLSYCTTCTSCPEVTGANPILTGECASLRIALVLDESGSISSNDAQQVANGVLAFVNTLSCTEVQLSVIEFRGNARFVLDGYKIVDNSVVQAMEDYFDGVNNPILLNNASYTPGGGPGASGTNYQAALLAVDALAETPDLVVFFTDGEPTAFFTNSNPTYGQESNINDNCNNGSGPQITNAVRLANKLKCEGAHIFAYGVTGSATVPLQAITGTVLYQNGLNNVSNADYVIGNFTGLEQGLAGFVEQLCPFETDIVSSDICSGGSDGSIALYVPVNLHPFDYAYYEGDAETPAGSGTNIMAFPHIISNLAAGPYRIEILVTLSGSACTRTEIFFDTIVADANNVVSEITDIQHPNCDEPEIGTATLTITTGVPPFTITLKKEGVTVAGYPLLQNEFVHLATGLDFGSYTYEVSDANLCNTDTVAFLIDEPINCCPEECTLIDGPVGDVCSGVQSGFGLTVDNCENAIYEWTIVNNTSGAIIEGTDADSVVTIEAGLCGEYTIQVSVTCEGCAPIICQRTVNVVDNAAPEFTVPVDFTIFMDENCTYDASIAVTGDVEDETDNCSSGLEADFNDVVIEDGCEGAFIIERTWSLVDHCGNVADVQIQTIVVSDITVPGFTAPVDITLYQDENCAYDAGISVTGDVTDETDNCAVGEAQFTDVEDNSDPCERIITRTWTLEDGCGNAAPEQMQTITIVDTISPVIGACAVTRSLSGCTASVITGPAYSTIPAVSSVEEFQDAVNEGVVNDNCGITEVTYFDVSAGTCPLIITRTWTLRDACGNEAICTQTILVEDVVPPVINCPNPTTPVHCPSGPNFGFPTATDDCDPSVQITFITLVTPGDCPQELIATRIWTATDECGNTATCSRAVTIVDDTPPVITCPTVVSPVSCPAAPVFGTATATDACDASVAITFVTDTTQGSCPQEIILTRIWTATDDCGNTSTCSRTIVVIDDTPPVINCPTVTSPISCPSVPDFGIATATDDCDPDVSVTHVTTTASGSCPQESIITRIWTATDDCGNTATCSRMVVIQDINPPSITCPDDITIAFNESTLPSNTGTATATDVCDGAPVISYEDDMPSEYVILRTWTAEDGCGNSTSCEQEIFIEGSGTICGRVIDDLAQPVPGVEVRLMADLNANQTEDGGDTLVATIFSDLVTGDFCFEDMLPGDYVLVEIQPLTYGNESDYDHTPDPDGDDSTDGPDDEIPVNLAPGELDMDNIFTDIICPIVLPVIPPDTICENGTGIFEIDDLNLGNLTYTWNFGSGASPSGGTGLGPHTISYITTTENQSSGAVIHLTISKDGCQDLEGPVSQVEINPYPDASIDASTSSGCYYTDRIFQPEAPEIPGASYQWNFGAAAVPASATGYGPHTVYYTASGTKSVKLVIHPNELGAQCPDSSTIMFTINTCPGQILGFVKSVTNVPIQGVNIRLFADADTNGVADNTTVIRSVFTTATGSYAMATLTPGHYVIIQTQPAGWFSFDDGDSSDDGDVVENIDSLDNLIPVTILPSEVDSFNNFIEIAIPGSITGAVFDDMDGDQAPDPGEGLAGILISLYADNNTDGVADSGIPVDTAITNSLGHYSFSDVPVGHYVVVETQPPGYVSFKDFDASNDNDVVPNTNMTDDIIPVTITNAEIDAHNYFIEDIATVTINCPPEMTISCEDDPSSASTGEASGSSNCSIVTIMYSDESTQLLEEDLCGHYTYDIIRTWVATDECGATNSCEQMIHVQDIEPPFWLTIPGALDVTLECSDVAGLELAQSWAPLADDLCDVDVTNLDKVSGLFVEGACVQEGSFTNTWTVTDACGNTSEIFTQVITVIDTTGPVWITISGDQFNVTLECSDVDGLAAAQLLGPPAFDNCAGMLITVDEVSGPFVEGSCPEAGTYTNIFYLEDNCGNSGPTYTQVITIVDSTAPVWSTISGSLDTILDCGDAAGITAAQALFPVAMDNCDPDVTDIIKDSGDFVPGECPGEGSFTNVWTVFDNCGNISEEFTQVIIIQDTTAPVVQTLAGSLDRTLECMDAQGLADALQLVPTAMDNCSTSPDILLVSDDTTPDEECPEAFVRVRVWHFTDECDNTSLSFSQTITVGDNVAPTFVRPGDITVFTDGECTYDISTTITGEVENEFDNCAEGLEATYVDVVNPGTCDGGLVILRTWSLTDLCGNAASDQVQTITVADNIAPTFTRPVDVTIQTDENCEYDASPLVTGNVEDESDNCSTGLTATYNDVVTEGICEGNDVIHRTWSLVDDCGNPAADQVQTITVVDNMAPMFTRPADITIYTDEACEYDASPFVAGEVVDASDNCSTALQASYQDVVMEGLCPGAQVITRTWNLIDDCGNIAGQQVQTITVEDNTPPSFSRPADITITTEDGCGYDPDPSFTGDVTDEADNCSIGLEATYVDVISGGPCNDTYIITRTWSLTDDCGNAAPDQVQTITIIECNLIVMNTHDNGLGSMRHLIDCAQEGDTIRFHSSLAGMTITITSNDIELSKDLVFESTLSPRVTIASEVMGMFIVHEDVIAEFRNLDIISGISPGTIGAAFDNMGILKLHDIYVYRNPLFMSGEYLIRARTSSQVIISGTCYIEMD